MEDYKETPPPDDAALREAVSAIVCELLANPDAIDPLKSKPWPVKVVLSPAFGEMKLEELMQLVQAHTAAQVEEAKSQGKLLVGADLAWCLGKLRGLGHPNEAMERRNGLTPSQTSKEKPHTEDKDNE